MPVPCENGSAETTVAERGCNLPDCGVAYWVSCSDIISKQYGGRRVGLQLYGGRQSRFANVEL